MMDREGRQRKYDLKVPEKEISNHKYASSSRKKKPLVFTSLCTHARHSGESRYQFRPYECQLCLGSKRSGLGAHSKIDIHC